MSTDAVTIDRPRRVVLTNRSNAAGQNLALARESQSDEELAVAAQAGSLSAFAELVARFETRLFNFLLRRAHNATDAEDLAQETFLRGWQQLHRYRTRCRFSTWLFTIGARLAVDLHRSRRPRLIFHAEQVPSTDHRQSVEHDSVLADSPYGEVWDVAARVLNEEQHSALWLRYAEDLSNREVGRVLGRTSLSVRVMLHRSRSILANALSTASRKEQTP